MIVNSIQKNIAQLIDRGVSMSNIEFTKIGSYCFANIYSEIQSDIITNSIFTGFDKSPEIALSKAVSELVERLAFRTSRDIFLPPFNNWNSDGFAAYPSELDCDGHIARNNAFNEALERYSWARWWDLRAAADICEIPISDVLLKQNTLESSLIGNLLKELGLRSIIKIQPTIDFKNKSVIILFLKLEDGGYISGGSCDDTTDRAFERGFSELYRHARAWIKVKNKNLSPQTFYEKRLVYFASGEGDRLVEETLNLSSKSNLCIPSSDLFFDSPIVHRHSDLYKCHRCLFKEQPVFVGGALERLCL